MIVITSKPQTEDKYQYSSQLIYTYDDSYVIRLSSTNPDESDIDVIMNKDELELTSRETYGVKLAYEYASVIQSGKGVFQLEYEYNNGECVDFYTFEHDFEYYLNYYYDDNKWKIKPKPYDRSRADIKSPLFISERPDPSLSYAERRSKLNDAIRDKIKPVIEYTKTLLEDPDTIGGHEYEYKARD